MRPEKVKNKSLKEKQRGGTKNLKTEYHTLTFDDQTQFLNKIICAPCETVLPEIPDNSIDMIITSPPYNFGHAYEGDINEDTNSWDDYFQRLLLIWQESYRVLKPGGRIAVNVQPLFSDYIPTHHIISNQLLNIGFLWKAEILWEKNNYNAKYTAWGSWKSPSMPYLKYTWEFIEVFDKTSHKKTGEKENIDITDVEFKEWVYSKWCFPPERKMKEFKHPAMFPEELPKRLMKLFTYKGDIVLDFFNGAGTTTLLAHKLKRRYIGLEISSEYCNIALNRIKQHDHQKSLFEEEVKFYYPEPELIVWPAKEE